MIPTRHTVRRPLSLLLIVSGTLLLGQIASGKNYAIPSDPPQSMDDITKVVSLDPATGEIVKSFQDAQCGGWNSSESLNYRGPQNPGKMALVKGAPGHLGNALGNITSGMAQRIESGGFDGKGYLFPQDMRGLTTACEQNKDTIQKVVWVADGGFIIRAVRTFEYPKFSDPPCQWRSEDPTDSPINGPSPLTYSQLKDPMTWDQCFNFALWLNKFLYLDCAKPVQDPLTGLYACAKWEDRYVCTDDWKDPPETANLPNADLCAGGSCRCPVPSGTINTCKIAFTSILTPKPTYQSFTRQYNATTIRDKISEVPKDKLASDPSGNPIKIPIECYGFYSEYDTKWKATTDKDKRCVINFPLNQDDLQKSQQGKGTFLAAASIDLQRVNRQPVFDDTKNLWYENLGGGMSLLSNAKFSKDFGGSLTKAFLKLTDKSDTLNSDLAFQRVSYQISPPQPYAKENALRAFDDTVSRDSNPDFDRQDERAFQRWWQRFQSDAEKFFTPGRIILKLPDSWSFDTKSLPVQDGTEVQRDPRTNSIDVQLRADDDLLGKVAAYIDHSLFVQISEEKVPVVIPSGNPTDFRAVKQRWCQWVIARDQLKNPPKDGDTPKKCADIAAPNVKQLMDRLEEYAVQIEQEERLRAELPLYINSLLGQQDKVMIGISDWVKKNLLLYKVFLANRKARLSLWVQWNTVWKSYTNFTEQQNLPWCRDDRFTTEVYSLLDPWIRRNPSLPLGKLDLQGGIPKCTNDGTGLPVLCTPEGESDYVFDLSNLKLTPGTIKFPVFEPIQVSLGNLPTPPPADKDIPDSLNITLPALPTVPHIDQRGIPRFPNVTQLSTPRVMSGAVNVNLAQAFSAFAGAKTLLDQMTLRTKEFWTNLKPTDDTKGLKCQGWNQAPCIYTEMDLMEQLQRIFARPMVLLKEDLAAVGLPRANVNNQKNRYATCNPEDYACLQLLPEKTAAQDGWQIVPPKTTGVGDDTFINNLRIQMRQQTIDQDGKITSDLPYTATASQLYPVFAIPKPTPLIPGTYSSSSASGASSS